MTHVFLSTSIQTRLSENLLDHQPPSATRILLAKVRRGFYCNLEVRERVRDEKYHDKLIVSRFGNPSQTCGLQDATDVSRMGLQETPCSLMIRCGKQRVDGGQYGRVNDGPNRHTTVLVLCA